MAASRKLSPTTDQASPELKTRWEGLELVVSAAKADRLTYFPLAPDDLAPAELVKAGQVSGRTLKITYPPQIAAAKQIKALIALERDGKTTYHWIVTAPPKRGS